jgi:hypothetical protein
MSNVCPFCGLDPYHYVDNGCGMERVAINCCDLGVALWHGEKIARQTLRFMRSPSPRKKARAMRTLREHGLRPERAIRGNTP